MESPNLGSSSQLNAFLLNQLIQGHSGSASETSRNAYVTHQGINEDDSQADPYPEAGVSQSQTMQKIGPDDRCDTVTGVREETLYRSKMVGCVQEEIP